MSYAPEAMQDDFKRKKLNKAPSPLQKHITHAQAKGTPCNISEKAIEERTLPKHSDDENKKANQPKSKKQVNEA